MKKTIVLFILVALVLVTVIFWFSSGSVKMGLGELITIGVIVLVVGFAIFVGYQRLTSLAKGEPAEDEMTRKVMLKTSSMSYYISIYLWLAIMYFSDRFKLESHTLIGAGILGMAIVFGICWMVYNFMGLRHE